MIKKIMFLISLFFLFFIVFYGVLPFIPVGNYKPGNLIHTVYLTTNNIHSSFLFPRNEADELLRFLPLDLLQVKDFEGVEFSFGDKDFFVEVPTWDEVTFKVLIDALLSPEAGLIHVDFFENIPVSSSAVIKMKIDDSQYKKLVIFIMDSFLTKNNGPIIYKSYGHHERDFFFLSPVRFHMFNTCNSWVGKALRYAGIKTGISTPHKWGILYHLR